MRLWPAFMMIACLSTPLSVAAESFSDDDANAVESLDVIELPADQPQIQPVSLNWDCDVLLLNTSQRYRPTACKRDEQSTTQLSELEVDRVELESAPDIRRKSRN